MADSVLYMIGGLIALYLGGEALVYGAVDIGRRCGLSILVVGLTILALGTSAPEMAVSIDAALRGSSELAIANVVGSNFANIALVLALSAVMIPIPIERVMLRRDMLVMMLGFLALGWMLYDDVLSRLEGAVLLSALVLYVSYLVRQAVRADDFADAEPYQGKPLWMILGLVVIGVALLAVGGDFLVAGAIDVAGRWGVSEAVIGLTVVAVGTSLPEIAASLVSLFRGHSDMAVGNVVGSNIWNTLCVLGVTAVIGDLERGAVGWHMLAVMAAAGLLLWLFCRTRMRLSRAEGLILLSAYLGYQTWLFT